ncbi:MAG: hypothetical protein KDI32_11245 [Pseudomonadales bacterium]|nr:hypothetical protein [Pseudomonadales bacterium]
MTNASNEPAVHLPRTTKGKRPHFFDDPSLDQMMTFLLELAAEVSVLRARQDTIERLMDEQGSVTRAAIEHYSPSPEVLADRTAWNAGFLQRVLRIHTVEK